MTKKYLIWLILIALFIAAVLFGAGNGAMKISPLQILSMLSSSIGLPSWAEYDLSHENVFWIIRLPRVVLAILIGASLAVSGTALQSLFRNPLADPALLGISSGAAFSAVVVIVLGGTFLFNENEAPTLWSFYALNVFTFIGALLTALLLYMMAYSEGKTDVATVILSGVALNTTFGALIGLMTYYANDAQLRNINFWTLGSLGGASWQVVLAILPFTIIPTLLLPSMHKQLNLISLGERDALYLGVNVQFLKIKILVLVTMAVGASVAVAGAIGFVGLVVPHILRLWNGPDQRFLLPASVIAGATLLVVADTVSRIMIAPAELPVGILTSLMGSPLFIWLLMKRKKNNVSLV